MQTKAAFPQTAGASFSGAYSDLSGKPTFAAVATTGAYNDLSGKPALGGAASVSVQSIRTIPQSGQTTGYTTTNTDVGCHVSVTGSVTVPSGVYSVGDVISIYNNSGSAITITQGASMTLILVGTATTGNRTLAQHGLATLLCVATNTMVVSGGGLT